MTQLPLSIKHTLHDQYGETTEVEISTSPLGVQVGPFFIFYEDERLCVSINTDGEVWSGDVVDPLTTKIHTHMVDDPDDTFTLTELGI